MKKILLTSGLFMSVAAAHAAIFDINLNAPNNPNGILSGVFEVGPNGSTATGGEVSSGITYDNATSLLSINVAYGLFGFQPLTGTFSCDIASPPSPWYPSLYVSDRKDSKLTEIPAKGMR